MERDEDTEASKTKKARLLEDPNVRRWYENLKRGSLHTGEVGIMRLSRICELASLVKKSPMDSESIAKLPQRELEDLVQDMVSLMETGKLNEGANYSPGYVKKIKDVLVSWLKHNERELKRETKIRDADVPVTLEGKEKAPEPRELDEILANAKLRGKVSISFMAYAGVRPEVLGYKDGMTGLELQDLPDLDLESLMFRAVPAKVIVRREISKARHQYFTFLPERGCGYLVAYLKKRRKEGEKLSPTSPVIRAETRHKIKAYLALQREEPTVFHIGTQSITDEVRRAIRKVGKDWRPYIERTYFASHTLTAVMEGFMSSEARIFFMGHTGDMSRRYSLNKHDLPKALDKAVKEHYLKGSLYLTGEVELLRREEEARVAGASEKEKQILQGLDAVQGWYVQFAESIRQGIIKDSAARGDPESVVKQRLEGFKPMFELVDKFPRRS